MQYTTYERATLFKEETFPTLLEKEAENNLIIGNILKLEKESLEGSFMATVKDDEKALQVVVVCTPPFSMRIYTTPWAKAHDALNFLAKTFCEYKINVPGVIGTSETVEAFSAFYGAYTGYHPKVKANLKGYKLTKVNPLPQVSGQLTLATLQDIYYLPYWQLGFREACHMSLPDFMTTVEMVERSVAHESLYVWKDEKPVSMAGKAKVLVNGIVVGQVYTPAHFRGHHYATACVGALSQKLLNEGHQFVALFAEQDNPISNKIYQAIGYQFIGYVKDIHFTKN